MLLTQVLFSLNTTARTDKTSVAAPAEEKLLKLLNNPAITKWDSLYSISTPFKQTNQFFIVDISFPCSYSYKYHNSKPSN